MERKYILNEIEKAFGVHPAVAILGPRQVGKTTIAHQYEESVHKEMDVHFFDLENPRDLYRLDNPQLALHGLTGLIIIDEIQFQPQLFSVLRVLIDQNETKQKFLILGSASRDLIQQSSETLAGRIAYIDVSGFTIRDTSDISRLWLRGGFPRAFLSRSNEEAFIWLQNYTRSFLERDIPNLGISIAPKTLRRFWMMLTHYHGNVINFSELGRSLGQSHTSIQRYVDILTDTFMIRQLQPWFENINKRQIKSPKIYFRDSGILNYLSGNETLKQLEISPRLGACWEGFALEQIIQVKNFDADNCYFWGIHGQGELDLFVLHQGKRLGFEFKYADVPCITPSIKKAIELLHLDKVTIVHPGEDTYEIDNKVDVQGLSSLATSLKD